MKFTFLNLKCYYYYYYYITYDTLFYLTKKITTMKLQISKLTSVFLLCMVSMLFYQCQSEDTSLISSDVDKGYVVYELNSSSLNDFLTTDRTDFSHLVMRLKDGIPVFQKATLNDEGISMHEDFVASDGKMKSINNGTQFQYWKEDFQYTYISLNEIESIINQSDKITLVGEEYLVTSNNSTKYFTLKINGDFKYSDDVQLRDGSGGKPCPEDCPPGSHGG